MGDVARDPAALDQLRAQRDRLADRMRPPWWGWAGAVVVCPVGFVADHLAGVQRVALVTGTRELENTPDHRGWIS